MSGLRDIAAHLEEGQNHQWLADSIFRKTVAG
jgi:hypothetical protein